MKIDFSLLSSRVLIIALIFTAAFFVCPILSDNYYQHLTQDIEAKQLQTQKQYEQTVLKQTDAAKLTEKALIFLKTDQVDLAEINLKQAVRLNPEFRDAWVLLGATQYQKQEFTNALASLKKAQSLDIINAKTYEYLALTYRALKQYDLEKQTLDHLAFLQK